MLSLPNITLFAIDCFTPERTWLAMRESMRWVKFGAVMLAHDMRKQNAFHNESKYNLQHIHREHSTQKLVVPGVPPLPVDYEYDALTLPALHVKTDYMIFMEWDSGVLNPDGWDIQFLEYDYIGAPWPDHHDPGWPICNYTNNVGNGGFCLKSRKFIEIIAECAKKDRKTTPGMLSSDRYQCRTMRPFLETQGIKFAPERVASRFSCENKIYSGQFGFHGRVSAEMNNWGGPWLENIRPNTK